MWTLVCWIQLGVICLAVKIDVEFMENIKLWEEVDDERGRAQGRALWDTCSDRRGLGERFELDKPSLFPV